MLSDAQLLRVRIKRWTLLLGVLQVTVGCLIGFIPASAIQWYRGLVMAHIEFTANGVLMVAFGFLATEMTLSAGALWAWFALLQIGTWTNGAAGLVAALQGSSSPLMPSINELFPPPGGTANALVDGLLKTCGVTITAALTTEIAWALRSPSFKKTPR